MNLLPDVLVVVRGPFVASILSIATFAFLVPWRSWVSQYSLQCPPVHACLPHDLAFTDSICTMIAYQFSTSG